MLQNSLSHLEKVKCSNKTLGSPINYPYLDTPKLYLDRKEMDLPNSKIE